MRLFKKIGLILLGLVICIAIAGFIFVQTLKPDYDGTKTLALLEKEVEVYYDTYGIPHIYGETEQDAFRVLGYVHAQDRLWQMELLRRIGSGGLSEVFGADLVSTDKFFLALGIDDASIQAVSELDRNKEAVQIAQAYLDGVNAFILEGPTPIEFYLTGIHKTEFTLKDMYNTMGYMAFSFAMAHKTDPLLTDIKNKLGPAYLKDLGINSSPSQEWIKNYSVSDSISNSVTALVSAALGKLNLPLFEGSNSWVLAPEKTENGQVIFTNDPHIGFAQPSVWYEAHVETPLYSKYGYHIAGIPFPVLGHNRNLAYGMTMFENDDVDFYYEENNPNDENQYKTVNGWESYQTIKKIIKVKDSETISFSYKKSIHGPILNGIADQVTGERPIAMSWIYTQQKNEVIDAFYGISHANNIEEFKKALPKIHAPGLNIMYGDREGNIGWFASAQLYKIPDSINTKFIFEPNKGLPVNKELVDFSQNPQAVNPPWNYVYSANNQPDSIAGNLVPGYYLPENRAKRIVNLLNPKDDWNIESTSKMMIDVTSSVNPSIIDDLVKMIDASTLTEEQLRLLDAINLWKGDYPLESVQATIYTRWEYFLLENIFKDELGEEMFKQFLSTHLHKRLIAPMAATPNSIWWDNVNTLDNKETTKHIIKDSFLDALASLNRDFGSNSEAWTWDKVHSLEHPHPIGQVAALKSFFNVGPFPIHGTREVINNMAFTYTGTGKYSTNSGPSTRRVIDFSDIENSISILPTGQSGNPFSKHYKDQAQMFVDGEFRKMMMNKEEIQKSSESVLNFKALHN